MWGLFSTYVERSMGEWKGSRKLNENSVNVVTGKKRRLCSETCGREYRVIVLGIPSVWVGMLCLHAVAPGMSPSAFFRCLFSPGQPEK